MRHIQLARKKLRRKRRVSSHIGGTADRPRISVFRSNRYIYTQAINDEQRLTLVASSSKAPFKNRDGNKMTKTESAKIVGLELAKLLLQKGIKNAVFDRNRFIYKGRVQKVAEGLREGGIRI